MNHEPHTPSHPEFDADMHKGAIEGLPENPEDAHAPGLDDDGLPNDPVRIAQDVIGANEDKTQG